MRIKAWVKGSNGKESTIIEIDDDDLTHCDGEAEKENYINNVVYDWASEHLEYGFEEMK